MSREHPYKEGAVRASSLNLGDRFRYDTIDAMAWLQIYQVKGYNFEKNLLDVEFDGQPEMTTNVGGDEWVHKV